LNLSSLSSDEFESTIERRLQSSPTRLVRDDYEPRGAAARLFASRDRREVVLVGAANTGKSRGCLELVHRDAVAWPDSRQLIARATRESLTQTAMVTLEKRVFPPGVFGDANSGKPIRFHGQRQQYEYPNGAVVAVAGLDDPEKTFSSEWDRIYVQEVNGLTVDQYESLLRAIRNAVIPPRGQIIADMHPQFELNWMHQRTDAGIALELLARHKDNPSLTPEQLADLAAMTGDRRLRLFLGKRVANVEGSYYGALLEEARAQGRLKRGLPIDPARPVYTSWDLGVSDFTVIWFWQVYGRERVVVDYYEMSGEGLGHYARVLQRKGYLYGTHFLPHDVEARVQAESAETRLDILKRLLPGHRFVVVKRVNDISDRIEAARALIPLCTFDNSLAPEDEPERRNTGKGIQRLIAYRRERNDRLGTFLAQPKHNEASHAADGFGTGAQGLAVVTVPKLKKTTHQSIGFEHVGLPPRW
jgi:phage terminase large subunit